MKKKNTPTIYVTVHTVVYIEALFDECAKR